MQESLVDRIVYASLSQVSGPIYHEMELIRASAVRNNLRDQVFTALLHQSGWFLQWKEGPAGTVQRTMDRVSRDPRHSGVRVMHYSRGPRLLPEPWTMAIVQLGDTHDAFAQRVAILEQERDNGYQYAPAVVWRRLSTPLTHPGAGRMHDPEAFQRVMVCSAYGTESFSLVRWLADAHRQEVVTRRFAGATMLDVGSDLTDVEEDGRVIRLIAMARNGLLLGLTRAVLSDCSHLVLLFSGDPQRDNELMERAVRACALAPQPPVLVSVGLDAVANHPLFVQAHKDGLIFLDAGVPRGSDHAVLWKALQPVLEHHRSESVSRWPVSQPG